MPKRTALGLTSRLIPRTWKSRAELVPFDKECDLSVNKAGCAESRPARADVSDFLCVRHTMTKRSQYAKQEEAGNG
jgi:hypothetical protein